MTAWGDPAACIRLAISGEALDESRDDLCECPPDNVDIAESIDEVLGGALPISARWCGAVAAMGCLVLVDEPPGGFEFRTGSETLLGVPFVSCRGRSDLLLLVSNGQTYSMDCDYLVFSNGIDSTEESSDL